MSPKEHIYADEIEVISADSPSSHSSTDKEARGGSHIGVSLFENIEEIKKIKWTAFIALLFAFIALFSENIFWSVASLSLASFDLWKGSKFTKKMDYISIGISILSFLNNI